MTVRNSLSSQFPACETPDCPGEILDLSDEDLAYTMTFDGVEHVITNEFTQVNPDEADSPPF